MVADRYYFQQHSMVWAVAGFLCGCLLAWTEASVWRVAVAAVTCLLLAGSLYWGRRELLVFVLLLLLGAWQMQQQTQQVSLTLATEPALTVSGVVTESRRGQDYFWMEVEQIAGGEQLAVPLAGRRLYVAMNAQQKGENLWYPAGARVQVQGKLQTPQGPRNPGGFDQKQWFWGKGACGKLTASKIQLSEEPRGIWRVSWRMQAEIAKTAERYLPSRQADLALALLLGEKQRLEPEFYRMTQRLGVAHVFAVSGLHAGFVGAALLLLLRLLGWERSWISLLLLTAGLSLYCLLAGCPPSALRATIMLLLAALAQRLLRPVNGFDFLAAAALLLLLGQPFLLFQAGFQLSFGVTLSLLLFAEPLERRLQWIGWRWLRSGVAVALAAYLGSLPLGVWHFYRLSSCAPICNLLLVPVVSIAVPLLLLALFIAWLLPTAGGVCFWPARFLLQLLEWNVRFLADHIGGQYFVGRPCWLAVVLYVLFLLLLWLLLQKQRITSLRQYVSAGRLSVLCLALLLLGICWPRPPATDQLLYLDAGQGSCALLRTAAGEVLIFDGGARESDLVNCLAWYGVNRVQAVILSHGDTDHIAGLMQVLEAVPVQYLCAEAGQLERETMQPLLEAARKADTKVKTTAQGAEFTLQQGSVQLAVYDDYEQSDNSRELTALLQLPWAAVAFPGDLSIQGVTAFVEQQERITVWTVPHHGSRYAADAALYRLLKMKGAEQAVISAGRQNRYGHPHAEVLRFLQQNEISWQRTDQQGAILLQGSNAEPHGFYHSA